MNQLGKPFYERHHDDEYFDEISIRMVPRFKTSGMSGDEWRVSAHIQLKRKGHVVLETTTNKLRSAAAFLPWLLLTAFEQDAVSRIPDDLDHALCFQVGCAEPAVSVFRFKSDYCDSGHKHEPCFREMRVAFCRKHLTRGDCGLKDADENLELVNGDGPEKTDWTDAPISESSRVEVRVDAVEDIPGALTNVMKDLEAK